MSKIQIIWHKLDITPKIPKNPDFEDIHVFAIANCPNSRSDPTEDDPGTLIFSQNFPNAYGCKIPLRHAMANLLSADTLEAKFTLLCPKVYALNFVPAIVPRRDC